MDWGSLRRRDLLRVGASAAGAGMAAAALPEVAAAQDSRRLVRFPGKTDMILITDRPPQLETPLHYFRQDLTPNEAYFVRWHLEGLPTAIDTRTYRITVDGLVNRPLSLSLQDLKTKFEPVELIAFNQCSGNQRSFFTPVPPGSQWKNGGMGNARWTGVRLRDVLERAGVRNGAVEVAFSGLDRSPMPNLPNMEKSLQLAHAGDGDVMLAYAMNGEDLPMLNGFPVRVVVPGWYATYWIKSLSRIRVLDKPLHNIWMDVAYRIPNNRYAIESHDHLATDTVPINRFSIHSIFVRPEPDEVLRVGRPYELQGLAMDAGLGITRVEVSLDGGRQWQDARLDPDLGRFSWRRWRLDWTPRQRGPFVLKVRATNKAGEQQIQSQWNHGGYARRVIEQTTGMIV